MYSIYVFWTGTNPITDNRNTCLQNLEIISETKVILVTPDNLNEFILPSEPLHPAYQ